LARGDLTDEQYARLEPLLPRNEGKRGRPFNDHRQVINGILWVQRTGAPWEDLPERYGPPTTCNDRLLRWKRDGTWDRVLRALQGEADARGGIEWEGCALDGSSVKAHPHAAGARKSPRKGGHRSRRSRARRGTRPGTAGGPVGGDRSAGRGG
jgi:transposase